MTPEARAEKVYPMDHYTHQVQREAYAAALRDDAARDERTSENAKLRALVQELTNRLHTERLKYSDIVDMLNIDHGLLSAKEQGFVPTNTTTEGR